MTGKTCGAADETAKKNNCIGATAHVARRRQHLRGERGRLRDVIVVRQLLCILQGGPQVVGLEMGSGSHKAEISHSKGGES